jgi:hypothetical protein
MGVAATADNPKQPEVVHLGGVAMPYKQLSGDVASLHRIRSHFNTVRKCVMTSMGLKGRVVEGVKAHARLAVEEVNAHGERWPEVPYVQRWVAKFHEYCDQNGLLTDEGDERDETSESTETQQLQSYVRPAEGFTRTGGTESGLVGGRPDRTLPAGIRGNSIRR